MTAAQQRAHGAKLTAELRRAEKAALRAIVGCPTSGPVFGFDLLRMAKAAKRLRAAQAALKAWRRRKPA